MPAGKLAGRVEGALGSRAHVQQDVLLEHIWTGLGYSQQQRQRLLLLLLLLLLRLLQGSKLHVRRDLVHDLQETDGHEAVLLGILD
jgi:hypothetical protein